MAVAYDTNGAGSTGTATPISWAHNASSSTDSAVLVAVAWTGTVFGSCSVTYDQGGTNVAMKQIANIPYNNTGTSSQLLIFGLMNPPTGSKTVQVAITATTTTHLAANSQSFTGVGWLGDETTAFGATGTTMSMNVNGFGGVIFQAFANSGTAAAGSYTGSSSYSGGASGDEFIMGYSVGSSSATAFSATQSNNAAWAGIGVPVKAVGVSGTFTDLLTNVSSFPVPLNTLGCYVTLIGGGGGGGGGTTPSAGSGNGGAGGGGGAYLARTFVPGSLLGSTYTITQGAKGTAGPLGNTTPASDGGAGGSSSFVSGSATLTAGGGGGGLGGANATPSGGTGGTTSFSGVTPSATETGATGGQGGLTGTLAGTVGGNSTNAGAGGGGGGANISSTGAGAAGGTSATATPGGTLGTAGGTFSAGGAGGVGTSSATVGGAGGGGGGGGNAANNAGVGGAGGSFGAGGGGGGGKQGTNANGAAGGVGGIGYAKVEWVIGDNNFMNFFPM